MEGFSGNFNQGIRGEILYFQPFVALLRVLCGIATTLPFIFAAPCKQFLFP